MTTRTLLFDSPFLLVFDHTRGLIERAHKNKVVVALAGALARIAWAVLHSGETFSKAERPKKA